MELVFRADRVIFRGETCEAGSYRLDPAKPFLHPLRTPAGHVASAATPHDHLHHKGLMMSLQTPEVSWWDEVPHPDALAVGRQRHTGFVGTAPDGFTESLLWEARDGSSPTFEETRRISCRELGAGFAWRWETRLHALRPCTLTQAASSLKLPGGTRVNYQGLALRLVRDFGQSARLFVDGERVPFGEASGRRPRRVRLEGRLDPVYPQWPGPRVAVTFESDGAHGLFALNVPFPYLALGPSNLAPVRLEEGAIVEARFGVTVEDLPSE